jgi:SAM-dependent methyltransferase
VKTSEYIEANKTAWNEASTVHAALHFDDLFERFKTPGYSALHRPFETELLLKQIELTDKAVAHLCCNNGRETLSLRNLGASRCVGFDISDEFVQQGRAFNRAAKQDVEFVCTSLYDIPAYYDARFDVVYITVGTFGWMPDLGKCFDVIGRLLKPGGKLFVYEMHPMLNMFDETQRRNPLEVKNSYFKDFPHVFTQGLDYFTGEPYKSEPMYWFHHKVSDIITETLRQDMELQLFEEHSHDISDAFKHMEKLEIRPPLCYILIAQKR